MTLTKKKQASHRAYKLNPKPAKMRSILAYKRDPELAKMQSTLAYQNNPEPAKMRSSVAYQNNPEPAKMRSSVAYQNNPEPAKMRSSLAYQKNPQAAKIQSTLAYRQNPEPAKMRSVHAYKCNPEKAKQYTRDRCKYQPHKRRLQNRQYYLRSREFTLKKPDFAHRQRYSERLNASIFNDRAVKVQVLKSFQKGRNCVGNSKLMMSTAVTVAVKRFMNRILHLRSSVAGDLLKVAQTVVNFKIDSREGFGKCMHSTHSEPYFYDAAYHCECIREVKYGSRDCRECMNDNGTWGTDVEIYALAHMLQTCVFLYCPLQGGVWNRYTPDLTTSFQGDLQKGMYLNHPSGHFEVVTSLQNTASE
jgi:hypothetical protein